MKHITIRDITLCALFCALTAVGAFISIPLPYGAVTLQWFFVVLAGFVLTPRQALLSMVCYVVLGLVGAPIFAGFTGGPSSLASPTFGFLIGMIACAPLTSLLLRTLKGKMPYVPAALIAGLAGGVPQCGGLSPVDALGHLGPSGSQQMGAVTGGLGIPGL